MPQPTEHKTVQARILQYAQDIGWSFVSQSQAEEMRNFAAGGHDIKERCRTASLYFEDTLYQKVKEFHRINCIFRGDSIPSHRNPDM